jgi:hypothetical protein
MTIKEYCTIAGVSKSAVTYRINNNLLLPGIKSFKKTDKKYVLTRDQTVNNNTIKQLFRSH